jgi:hypothetical protein
MPEYKNERKNTAKDQKCHEPSFVGNMGENNRFGLWGLVRKVWLMRG